MSALLETVKLMDEVAQRKIASILGAAVADAAARPLHWVYDNTALQSYIEHVQEKPEFLSENKSPFYSLPTGENSCYWDIAEASLTAIANSKDGAYDYDSICTELMKSFGPGNTKGYDATAFQEFAKKIKARNIDAPFNGKYFQEGVVNFLKAYESDSDKRPYGGSKMRSTDGFCLNLPIALKFAGNQNFDTISQEVIQTMSTWKTATQLAVTASKIVAHLIESPSYDIMSIRNEIAGTHPKATRSIDEIRDTLSKNMDHSKAVIQIFGPACNNPSSFQGAIHATVTSSSYTEAVRRTVRAGGCNCSRAFFIGAMCGAKYGIEGIPREWIDNTTHAEKILSLAINAYS